MTMLGRSSLNLCAHDKGIPSGGGDNGAGLVLLILSSLPNRWRVRRAPPSLDEFSGTKQETVRRKAVLPFTAAWQVCSIL